MGRRRLDRVPDCEGGLRCAVIFALEPEASSRSPDHATRGEHPTANRNSSACRQRLEASAIFSSRRSSTNGFGASSTRMSTIRSTVDSLFG
jgi:hypothetical protein